MITNDQLKKRVLETKKEIFPLDRLLPLETVYSIFLEEYTGIDDRSLFFSDRKFQRLREGYFALFVTISLNKTTKENHLLLFPSSPDNDIYIVYPKEDKLMSYAFDVKEFTNWSDSFASFVDKKIIPKIDTYNLIIATYRKIDGSDLSYIVQCLDQKNIDSKIWILGSPSEKGDDPNISQVIIVNRHGFVYDQAINLNDWIDENKPPVVYQDIVRLVKPFSD